MGQLTVGDIIKNGFARGLKNILAVVVNFILWAITIWIPYINVGTTIGLVIGIITKMKNGETISLTEVFNPEYRKKMGEFFLASAFVGLGVAIGTAFLVIPGIVIGIAWSLTILLVVDKGMGPLEAITKSNELTYGKKWTIFGGAIVLSLITGVAGGVVIGLISLINVMFLTALFGIVVVALSACIMLGAASYIYGTLAG